MLTKIGGRQSGGDSDNRVVAGLLECHERIRRFTGYAARLGSEEDFEGEQVAETAQAVIRYFREALPLHSADEDDSIAPRLRDAATDVKAALAAMRQQHTHLHEELDRMFPLWERVAAEPRERAALRGELADGAARLETLFHEHLSLEERVVLPAIEQLAPDIVERIAAEMAARRRPAG